jgi:hypothetical protein
LAVEEHDLIEAERTLLDAIGTRARVNVDLSTGDPELDDPADGGEWPRERTLHAEILERLLSESPDLRSVTIVGARVAGKLDLQGVALPCPITMEGCFFDAAIDLSEARAAAIRLLRCRLQRLEADQLETRGNLEVRDSNALAINLVGAHVGGLLILSGAELIGETGLALNADGLRVEGRMSCGDGFKAHGGVRLVGAHLRELSFGGAELTSESGAALQADRLRVYGGMFCRDRFKADGGVHLPGAHIGALSLAGAELTTKSGSALHADGLRVDGTMFCSGGFKAHGEVRLLGVRVGDQLIFEGADLSDPTGRLALNLGEARVEGILLLRRLRRTPGGAINFGATAASVGDGKSS